MTKNVCVSFHLSVPFLFFYLKTFFCARRHLRTLKSLLTLLTFFSSAVIEDDTAELVILLIVRRRPSVVRCPSTIVLLTSSSEPHIRMLSNIIFWYLCYFCIKILFFVFLRIFWVIFNQKWYFQSWSYYWLSTIVHVCQQLYFWLLLQNCNSECFQIQYTSTLGGSLSDLFILCPNLKISIFGEYFWSK